MYKLRLTNFTKLLLMVLMSVAFTLQATAQNRTITGKVSDPDGTGLSGATVFLQGTNVGAFTKDDGSFTLSVPTAGGTLIVTYQGFTRQEVEIGSNSVISITMEEDILSLDQVVVVGYGTQRRVDVTGAVSSVASDDIQKINTPGIDGALQGQVPGLLVNSNSGAPGGGISVRIRGNSSINAGNEPLYVIDGIPVTTGDFSANAYGGQDFNALTDLNPSEIESVEVLKDAAAASIYGSRASNGVVLITTKRGKAGRPKVSFNGYMGVQNPVNQYTMLTGEQFTELFNESRGIDPADNPWNGLNTNFTELITNENAGIQSYDVSISGGDLKTKYRLSGSLFDQEGTVIGQNYNRVTGRLNLDHQATDKLSFSTGVSITRSNTNVVNSDNNIYGAMSLSILQPSNVAAFNDDGSYNFAGMIFENPVATALENDQILNTFRTLANISARYEIIEGLNFQSKYGYDQVNFSERGYIPATVNRGAGNQGIASLNTSDALRGVFQNTLDFQRSVGDFRINVLAGIDYERYVVQSTNLAGNGFPSPSFRFLTSAAEYTDADQSETENRLLSYYGRAGFNYKDRYLFTATFRADGSSKFGANNKYGYFPSASFAWRLSNESFMEGADWLSDARLRASYGLTGNQQGIGNFASRGLAGGGFNYGGLPGVASSQLENPDLKWETTRELNIGLNLAVLNERVGLAVDYYNKYTTDLLLARPIPGSSGFTTITQNVGEMSNKGIEVLLNLVPVRTQDFNWDFSFQFARNRNLVEKLYEGQGFDAGFANRIDEGQPLGYFFAWKALNDGFVNPETGDIDYEDLNGDGLITAADDQFIGDPNPDFIGGLKNNLSYKGLTLDFFFQFTYGNDILNYTRVFSQDGIRRGFGNTVEVLDRWQNPGDVTKIPQITGRGGANGARNNATSSRYIEDGSYLRLKAITLSYDFPSSMLSAIKVQALRVYVAANNIWTLTNYTGLDPEVNFDGTSNLTLGTDFLTQGVNSTVTGGINITF